MKKIKLSVAIALLAAIGFSGCQSAKKITEDCQHLRETKWELRALNNQPIDPKSFEEQPYIVFMTDGNFSGNLGCNTFFGTYYNKKKKLELDYTGATRRLCQAMEMEDAFSKALHKEITTFTISDSTLILYAGKEEIFRFVDKGKFTEGNE